MPTFQELVDRWNEETTEINALLAAVEAGFGLTPRDQTGAVVVPTFKLEQDVNDLTAIRQRLEKITAAMDASKTATPFAAPTKAK